MNASTRNILWFKEISADDVGLVGGKNASLGELYGSLSPQGVNVPNGFAVTAAAYRDTLEAAKLHGPLHELLDGVDKKDVEDLSRRAGAARQLVLDAEFSTELSEDIARAYRELKREYGSTLTVAVRSSATAEDLPTASFAGQHESYLNIRGESSLLDACKRCFASLFTERAVAYRIDQGFDHFAVSLSIGIMKMVRADLAASGVIFTLDTESGFPDVVLITGAYGLGENVVQGAVEPDEFYVHKPTFEQDYRCVLRRTLGAKKVKMVYRRQRGGATTRNVATSRSDRARACIDDAEVLQLADFAVRIERHYSDRAGRASPMDIEWAKDGLDNELYIVQARPETVASQSNAVHLEQYHLDGTGPVLATGRAVGTRISSGPARTIQGVEQLASFQPGEVLVAEETTPDWGPVMKTAGAIVTDRGGRTCHAAIVARELGIAAVVGTNSGTTTIRDGDHVTVSCAEGEIGQVYDGDVPFGVTRTDLSELPRPQTEIMLNLADPDVAFKTSRLPNDGVGLLRMEFIIGEQIKVHPMALVHPEKIRSVKDRRALQRLVAGYAEPRDFFIERLAEGVGTIAAAFYPKPVIVRMSDFKTNEYASLLGGRWFEPVESNPMLGFRGASRYAHPDYAAGFALECAAMRRVREIMGMTNVKLMIPFCRRVEEGERVLEAMAAQGLVRGENGLEIYVMSEIPNNVIQVDAFAQLFDGFSIGSNDLTQLSLGVDRDSDLVAFDFDERDPGVKEMIRLAVAGAKRNGRHCGICGQAPSDYPEMAEYLVGIGIDSLSLNPDSVLATTLRVLEVEKRLGVAPRTCDAEKPKQKTRSTS